MTECTERGEGREGMPALWSMTGCTERGDGPVGRERVPDRVSA